MAPKKRTGPPTAFDAPPVLTGKRKRATVSYVDVEGEIDATSKDEDLKPVEEIITSDSDEDADFGISHKTASKKAKKAKKTAKPKSPKNVKRFRFLDLPPELRDMIYEMALVDPNQVSIVTTLTKPRGGHLVPTRGRVREETIYSYGRHESVSNGGSEISPISTTFTTALLAVNKQINTEAINYLYGHEFSFEDCAALADFLAAIGYRNQQRLNVVKIVSWGAHSSSASKPVNRSGLTMLAGATNLNELILACSICGSSPRNMAQRLFQDGQYFIRAYGAAHGRKDAAVDIIKLVDQNILRYQRKGADKDKVQSVFKKVLRELAETL